MNEHIRQGAQLVRGAVQQSIQDRDAEMQLKGFSRAAHISLRRIQEKLDLFRERMNAPGTGLTKAEQTAYSQLVTLHSEIEVDFDRYWHDVGADWRPRKPVTKAIIMPSKSPE